MGDFIKVDADEIPIPSGWTPRMVAVIILERALQCPSNENFGGCVICKSESVMAVEMTWWMDSLGNGIWKFDCNAVPRQVFIGSAEFFQQTR